ncbi:MAG: Maf family nucleotide pyrophosphatase [Sediminibacterium sp.]|jgi:septum formation protein|nr:Maf family nucleotide pyrophosphatase [Sediminibacterium sp.]
MQPLILASQSPRRQMLLTWADVPFEVIVSDSDETYPATMDLNEVPVYIAKNKAQAVYEKIILSYPQHSNKNIVAADTIVVLEGNVLGKPANKAEAIASLTALSGKTHRVITGVVLRYQDKEYSFSETTLVTFNTLTLAQIEYYIENYKPYDKAGGYAIQEWIGVVGIHSIEGDFYNVMGLPVSKLLQKIKQLEVN